MLGHFDGWRCLGKVLARLHARLPGGLGRDWCLEKEVGGEVGKSAGKSPQREVVRSSVGAGVVYPHFRGSFA